METKTPLDDKYKPTINQIKVEYTQEADSNSTDGDQFLELSTDDAGGGVYFVLKSERWAFDNVQEIIDILQDFEKRLGSERN